MPLPRRVPPWLVFGVLASSVMAIALAWLLYALATMFGPPRNSEVAVDVWLMAMAPVMVAAAVIVAAVASWRRQRIGLSAILVAIGIIFPPLVFGMLR